jgi:(E)-4-hydroxy-3-methylbut-2-enyl-diphosphate synthase
MSQTTQIYIKNVPIGGGAPVSIQSMTNTKTQDVSATLDQIRELVGAGCELVRIAIPDMNSAKVVDQLCSYSPVPLIADIHYDYRLALAALERGIHGLRLNPGNLRNPEKIVTIVEQAARRSVPIRVGVNGGSLNPHLYQTVTAETLVAQALEHIHILEDLDFPLIKVSLKASDVTTTVQAYRLMAQTRSYPLHVGVTEAGTYENGVVKNAIGIGSLLLDGIGDTIRVSLSADPVQEVIAAKRILKAIGLRKEGLEIVSCPTCGRTVGDVIFWAERLEHELNDVPIPLVIAVMGCRVNGVGESRHADLGIILDGDPIPVYRHGKVLVKVPENQLIGELRRLIEQITSEK